MMISCTEVIAHGSPHLKIETPKAIFLFDMTGGGISEMIDIDGKDWVQFDNVEPPVCYRGIPNLQMYHGEGKYTGIFHPGYGNVTCCVVEQSEDKVSISCDADVQGAWHCRWDFTADYASCTVDRGIDVGFAFLYEGVPGGGAFSPHDSYIMESDGTKTYFGEARFTPIWAKPLRPSWCCFGRDGVNRTLVYVHHEEDDVQEAVYQVFDALTVFGWGRDAFPHGIKTYPTRFTIGFCESDRINDVKTVAEAMMRSAQ